MPYKKIASAPRNTSLLRHDILHQKLSPNKKMAELAAHYAIRPPVEAVAEKGAIQKCHYFKKLDKDIQRTILHLIDQTPIDDIPHGKSKEHLAAISSEREVMAKRKAILTNPTGYSIQTIFNPVPQADLAKIISEWIDALPTLSPECLRQNTRESITVANSLGLTLLGQEWITKLFEKVTEVSTGLIQAIRFDILTQDLVVPKTVLSALYHHLLPKLTNPIDIHTLRVSEMKILIVELENEADMTDFLLRLCPVGTVTKAQCEEMWDVARANGKSSLSLEITRLKLASAVVSSERLL